MLCLRRRESVTLARKDRTPGMTTATKHALTLELLVGAGLFVLSAWLFFGGLGDAPFHDGDEALYTSISVEMLASGDLLTPRYCGELFLNKPPLPYWLMALSMKSVPGSLEFKARFPSALAAMLLLIAVFITGRRMAGIAAGTAAALLLMLNHQVLFEHAGRSASFDALLMLLSFLAIVCGMHSRERRLARVASAVCVSLAMLVKAPFALLPLGFVLIHQWFTDRRSAISYLRWTLGCVIVIALPWHIFQFAAHGREFWETYFVYEMFGRAGAAVTAYSSRFVHLKAFWLSFFPWSPLLIVAAVATLVRWRGAFDGNRDVAGGARRALWLFAAYGVFLLIALCFFASKWPWYGLPAYPMLAVVGAVWATDAARQKARWFFALPVALAVLFVLRVLVFDANSLYNPAARSSYLWPGWTTLLWVAEKTPGAFEWIASAAVLACALAAVLMRHSRRAVIASTVVVSLSIFAACSWTAARVPREYRAEARGLVSELNNQNYEAVYLLGFPHAPWYNDRMDPLASVYFLTTMRGTVKDCRNDPRCLPASLGGRTALVFNFNAASQRDAIPRLLASLPPYGEKLEVWLLQTEGQKGYRRVK